MIRRPCTDFLTRPSACLSCLSYLSDRPTCLCLPVGAYLSVPACPACPTCLTVLPVCAYLSVPTCLCLPVVPTCLCLPVCTCNSGRGRPDRRLCLIRLRLIVLTRIVLYGRSLAVRLNGGRLGCLPKRP